MCCFKKILLTSIVVLGCITGYGQMDRTARYSYADWSGGTEGNLSFRFEGLSFFQNDEYNDDFIEGYTLIGYSVQPSVLYNLTPKLRLKAGVHLLQYHGVSDFSELIPVYSAHLKLFKNLDLIMGALKGDVQHRMIEPVFNPENQYTRPVEQGIQFLFKGKNVWVDTWLDWDQFIFSDDTIPERFTYGLSMEFDLLKTTSGFKLSLPFQFIARHTGGQIGHYSERQKTLTNSVFGLRLARDFKGGIVKGIDLDVYSLFYNDISDDIVYYYSNGNALYYTLKVDYGHGELMLGYWDADKFMAPKGSALFHSLTSLDYIFYRKSRQMFNTKFSYQKKIAKYADLSLMFESYYDLNISKMEYSYGVHLLVTPSYFIRNFKPSGSQK